jgi:hypothetical protein
MRPVVDRFGSNHSNKYFMRPGIASVFIHPIGPAFQGFVNQIVFLCVKGDRQKRGNTRFRPGKP